MKLCAIGRLTVEPSGELFVRPVTSEPRLYEYIYREANGLRWDASRQAICAHEPHRWHHAELLRQIAATLHSAFDEELRFTEGTAWVGVSPELQLELLRTLEEGSHSLVAVSPNPSIERTSSSKLRLLAAAAHVER